MEPFTRARAATILVCGAPVFDYRASCATLFSESSKGAIRQMTIDCASEVPLKSFTRTFGGCAFNIGHNFRLLGQRPIVVASAGRDFSTGYEAQCRELGIDTAFVSVVEDQPNSANCLTLEDQSGRAVYFSSPGPIMRDPSVVARAASSVKPELAVVSSDCEENMMLVAKELRDQAIPHVFAPGPDLFHCQSDNLASILGGCKFLHLNEKECQHLEALLPGKLFDLHPGISAVIVTRGADGATATTSHDERLSVPAIHSPAAVDPVGCGDAHLAGCFSGVVKNFELGDALAIGNLMASFNVECLGTQNHRPCFDVIAGRGKKAYGLDLSRLSG